LINRLWFLAGLAALLLIFFGLTKEIVNRRQISKQISDYNEKIQELKEENAALSEKIGNWDRSGGLELDARTKLGLEKPGEQTIVINRAASADAIAVKSNQEVIDLSAADPENPSGSNASRWWNYFFH